MKLLASCCVAVIIVVALEHCNAQKLSYDVSYRELISKSAHCKMCTGNWRTSPTFCNIVATSSSTTRVQAGSIFDENIAVDPCYCDKLGSIFYAKDPILPACTGVPNICQTLNKEDVCNEFGATCDGSLWSTFRCNCSPQWQGQICHIPKSNGEVVKNPILVNYLHAPLFQKQPSSGPALLPGLYFITESLGDEFQLTVSFGEGRKIKVRPDLFKRKNYRQECLTNIKEKIHFIAEHHCNLIPKGIVYGYGIFLDKMLRVNINAPDNVFPTNPLYARTRKSMGRFSNQQIQVFNKGNVSWEWEAFSVFVPHERFFIQCSRDVILRGCARNRRLPDVKIVNEPMTLKASYEMWPGFDNDCNEKFKMDDHRWQLEDITDLDKLDDLIPTPLLSSKFSLGPRGNIKVIPAGQLVGGNYLVIYDLVLKGISSNFAGKQYVTRHMCYLRGEEDKVMKLSVKQEKKGVGCKKGSTSLLNVTVENFNNIYYANEDFTFDWTCKPNCPGKTIKGNLGSHIFSVRCAMTTYSFLGTVKHKRYKEPIELHFEFTLYFGDGTVSISCIENCSYKLNPDKALLLEAKEIPRSSKSWSWEIREVGKGGDVGPDLAAGLRDSESEDNVCIIPPGKLEVGKDYIIFARTYAYSSFSIMVNNRPVGGVCDVNPHTGTALETEFQITCDGWTDVDLPLSYKIFDIPDPTGPEARLLYSSETGLISRLKFSSGNIMIMITDVTGVSTQYNLTVTLGKSENPVTEDFVKEALENITSRLDGDAQEVGLADLDELTRLIEEQEVEISDDISMKLIHSISQIDTVDNPTDLDKGINVIKRVIGMNVTGKKEHTDNLLLEGSKQLKKYAEIAESMNENYRFQSSSEKEALTASISKASCEILLKKDTEIEEDDISEERHEEHKQRLKKATQNSLQAMAILGTINSKGFKASKYSSENDCFKIETKTGNGTQIENQINDVSFPEEYYNESETMNTSVITPSAGMMWGSPNDEIGLIGVMNSYPSMYKGDNRPLDVAITVPNYKKRFVTISGEFNPVPVCTTQKKLDRSFDVHNLRLPDGDGVVVLDFQPTMVGRVNLFAQQGRKPGYQDVKTKDILNSTAAHVGFSNRNAAIQSDFYVAMVANNQESQKVEYNFTTRILRCSIYSGGRFLSRGCTFLRLAFPETQKDPVIYCRCNRTNDPSSKTTWYSVNVFLPEHSLVTSQEVYLYSVITDNVYAALLVGILILLLLCALLWSYRLDKQDENSRHIIQLEDNYPGDDHAYVIAVFTGQSLGAGTTSKVAFRLIGTSGYSRVHILAHSEVRDVLKTGHDDWFLMTSHKKLGRIKKIQIWHNHVGTSPEWYCTKISVFDVKQHVKYDFMVERWFTFDVRVSEDEAQRYEGKAATEVEEIKKWYLLVGSWIVSDLREKHQFASIFRRHPRSLYTRCQRVIITVTFITTTMLVSLMFFGVSAGPSDYPLMPFNLAEIWTGIKSSLISTAITLAVVICFNKHKKYETSSLHEEQNFEVETASEVSAKKKKAKRESDEKASKYQTMVLKYIQPTPVEYKPVMFGVEEPKPRMLSNAFLCAGWIVAFATISVTLFFVVWYGSKFGPKKTMAWGLTFLTGAIAENVFVGPLKVAIMALVVARIFHKSPLDSFTMQIKVDSSQLARRNYIGRLKWNFHMRLRDEYKPTRMIKLRFIRRRNKRGREFEYLLAHFMMVALMIVVVLFLSNLLGLREGYDHIRQLRELLSEGKINQNGSRVLNENSMYRFFSRTVLPALHITSWYSNKTLEVERNERKADPNSTRYRSQVRGFVKDYTHKLMGVPRVRQLRLSNLIFNKGRVHPVFRRVQSKALKGYSHFGIDWHSYLESWIPYNDSHGLQEAWPYQTPVKSVTGSATGYSYEVYMGGGQVTHLSWNLGDSSRRLKSLEMNDWITNLTRCTIFEMNVYNNNIRHFTVLVYIIEALPSGMYWNRLQMDVAKVNLPGSPESQEVLLIVIILCIMIVLYCVLCFWHASRQGIIYYVTSLRGLSDLAVIGVGFLVFSTQLSRCLDNSIITDSLDSQPRDSYTSMYGHLLVKEQSNQYFAIFCLVMTFNICCTLIKLEVYSRVVQVIPKVYDVTIGALIILVLLSIIITMSSTLLGMQLGKFFTFHFTFKDEMYHKFTEQSKLFYLFLSPITFALLEFHAGYLASAYITQSRDMGPPKVVVPKWLLARIIIMPLLRWKKNRGRPRRKKPQSQIETKLKELDDKFKLLNN